MPEDWLISYKNGKRQIEKQTPLLEGGLVQEGRVSLLLAGLLPYYALFFEFHISTKSINFLAFGTVKVYSPNIFLSYIKKI